MVDRSDSELALPSEASILLIYYIVIHLIILLSLYILLAGLKNGETPGSWLPRNEAF